MSSQSDIVIEKLRLAWRKERRFIHLRGLARLALWAVTLLLVDWVVDFLFIARLRGSGDLTLLWLLLGLNGVILVWALVVEWLRHLRRFDALHTALQLERKHPELSSLLVSYVQFGDPAVRPQDASAELIDAMRSQALEVTRPLDFREVVDFRQLRRLVMTAALVLLLFGTMSYYKSDHFKTLLRRMAGVDARYPTRTRITFVTPSPTVPMGGALTLTARAAGRVPEVGTLYVRTHDDQPWQKALFPLDETLVYTSEMGEVHEGFSYYARIGDDQTEPMRVTVIPPPQVREARITVRHPEYMNASDLVFNELNVEAPQGCRLVWELDLDRAVSQAEAVVNESRTVPLTISEDGLTARLDLPLDETLRYFFRWTERDHGFVFDDILRVARALDDRAPEVALVAPAENGVATAARKLEIVARATDDYGVKDAALIYSFNAGPEQRIPLGDLQGGLVEIRYAWDLAATFTEMSERDVISFSVEVRDTCLAVEGGQVGRSPERSLEILSVSEYLRRMAERLTAERNVLLGVFEEEKAAGEAIAQLIIEAGGEAPAIQAARPEVAAEVPSVQPAAASGAEPSPALVQQAEAESPEEPEAPQEDWWDRL